MDPPWALRRPLPAWRLSRPPPDADQIDEPMPRMYSPRRASSLFVGASPKPERRVLTQQQLTPPTMREPPESVYSIPPAAFTGVRIDSQAQSLLSAVAAPAPSGKPQRRRGRVCKFEGCENYIVRKGLCCRHGGGKKCSAVNCESSAKYKGRCWKHGGSVECKVADCSKKAKARGFCWAHGGGKRCIFDGCQRASYERTHSFCVKHYEELQGVDYYEV